MFADERGIACQFLLIDLAIVKTERKEVFKLFFVDEGNKLGEVDIEWVLCFCVEFIADTEAVPAEGRYLHERRVGVECVFELNKFVYECEWDLM